MTVDQIRHGTHSGYNTHRCRCDECRAFNTRACLDSREKRKKLGRDLPFLIPHGTAGGYENWSCRCEDCTDAHTTRLRLTNQARRRRGKR